ncbi:MAG: hypothetical protein K9J85_10360 [Desulfobacteraceae bacterium]|nr:hypothetical protein [Desulfobacteraceae bacterium]
MSEEKKTARIAYVKTEIAAGKERRPFGCGDAKKQITINIKKDPKDIVPAFLFLGRQTNN